MDTRLTTRATHLSEEPRNEVAKDDSLVGLGVSCGGRDGGGIPQVGLPLVEEAVPGLGVNQQHAGGTLDQPAAVDYADSPLLHGLDGGAQLGVRGREGLDLDGGLHHGDQYTGAADGSAQRETYRLPIERADERVAVAILGGGDGGFGLEDRVDSPN